LKQLNGEEGPKKTKVTSSKHVKTPEAAAHEKWLEELADELQAYYQNQDQACVTSEGFSGLTLVCFARLVAAWDPRMERADFQHLLGCMKNDEQPWMVSTRAFKLWTAHTFGPFSEEVSIRALEALTPVDMPSRLKMRIKSATCVRNWLMKEAEPCGTQKDKSEVGLKKTTWAQQLLAMAGTRQSGRDAATVSSTTIFSIIAETVGDMEAREACMDSDKVWDELALAKWLESTNLPRRDFNAAMLRLMASNKIIANEEALALSRIRTHISLQMGMELARCHDSTWMGEEMLPMDEVMKSSAMPEVLTMGGDAEENSLEVTTVFDQSVFDAVTNRYDLDQSGRIESDSLMPCTLNLVLKLQITVDPAEMEAAAEELVAHIEKQAKEPEECMMTIQDYKTWFTERFVHNQ